MIILLLAVHFLAGLAPGTYSVQLDGQPLLQERVGEDGILSYLGPEHGLYTVDTLWIPTCANLQPVRNEKQPVSCAGPLVLRAQVKNVGTQACGPSHTKFYLDGTALGEVPTPGMAAGTMVWSDWLSVPNPPPGQHLWWVCVDSRGEIPETIETDNCSGP